MDDQEKLLRFLPGLSFDHAKGESYAEVEESVERACFSKGCLAVIPGNAEFNQGGVVIA